MMTMTMTNQTMMISMEDFPWHCEIEIESEIEIECRFLNLLSRESPPMRCVGVSCVYFETVFSISSFLLREIQLLASEIYSGESRF